MTSRIVRFVLLPLMLLPLMAPSVAASSWQTRLANDLAAADRAFSGDLSVYIKDIDSGEEVALRADSPWYLASSVKVFIAVALYSQVEQGKLTLDDKVTLDYSDYVDGAGNTNWSEVGTVFTLHQLYRKMVIESDNTATDMVIRTLGLDNINNTIAALELNYVGPITTLADVRRLAYSEFHKGAHEFASTEFFRIQKASDPEGRANVIAELFGVTRAELGQPDLDSAFDAYYATTYNSGSMRGVGQYLELLVGGALLSEKYTAKLLDTMESITTGGNRLQATLPEGIRFAHKTGTQHRRACDVGIVWAKPNRKRPVVVAACTRGPLSTAEAEAALRAVGTAITRSGLLD
ncbi:serine hydrolase [Arsukibacterium sp.]|uniref:serine hydrolase n=1 Tax=Arsukibacterium sp. TaxID=1977258 RepID=UPI001BD5A6E9|nr:serine hydrolase [Arsukibacterium sp.]